VVPAVPSSGDRHVRSGPCTPDAYGYCLYQTGHGKFIVPPSACPDYGTLTVNWTSYTLYDNGTADGTYTYYDNSCVNGPYWDPDDPSVATGDPLLP
jgi:hypothetical protein